MPIWGIIWTGNSYKWNIISVNQYCMESEVILYYYVFTTIYSEGADLFNYLWMVLIVKGWVPFFRFGGEDYGILYNTLDGCIYWLDVVVNLFQNHELLMYAKSIAFLVVIINIYGNIFYKLDLLPWLANTPLL